MSKTSREEKIKWPHGIDFFWKPLSYVGNGNPLQYSCLENPMDGRAWFRLLSMGLRRVGYDWATSLHFTSNYVYNGMERIRKWKSKSLNSVWLFATPWTVACQAPLSMEFSRSTYWSGLPCPPPGNLPNPGIKLRSLTLQVDSLPVEPPGKSMERVKCYQFMES